MLTSLLQHRTSRNIGPADQIANEVAHTVAPPPELTVADDALGFGSDRGSRPKTRGQRRSVARPPTARTGEALAWMKHDFMRRRSIRARLIGSGPRELVTIGGLHRLFAVSVSPLFRRPRAKQ